LADQALVGATLIRLRGDWSWVASTRPTWLARPFSAPHICDLYRADSRGWRWDVFAVFSQRLDMQGDCLPEVHRDLFDCGSCRDATRKVWHVCRKVLTCILDHDRVLGHRSFRASPACRTTLPTVPFASSSPGLPGTGTVPGFELFRN